MQKDVDIIRDMERNNSRCFRKGRIRFETQSRTSLAISVADVSANLFFSKDVSSKDVASEESFFEWTFFQTKLLEGFSLEKRVL